MILPGSDPQRETPPLKAGFFIPHHALADGRGILFMCIITIYGDCPSCKGKGTGVSIWEDISKLECVKCGHRFRVGSDTKQPDPLIFGATRREEW